MAITLQTLKQASYSKTITLAATKLLKVLNNEVEDSDFRVTAPNDGITEVTITVQVVSRS